MNGGLSFFLLRHELDQLFLADIILLRPSPLHQWRALKRRSRFGGEGRLRSVPAERTRLRSRRKAPFQLPQQRPQATAAVARRVAWASMPVSPQVGNRRRSPPVSPRVGNRRKDEDLRKPARATRSAEANSGPSRLCPPKFWNFSVLEPHEHQDCLYGMNYR